MSYIKDSGSRTEFATGAVRDLGGADKGRCDLMPLDVIAEITGDSVIQNIAEFTEKGVRAFLAYALDNFRGYTNYPDMFLEVSKHFAAGCEKYGEDNWKKGIPVKSYINSGVRHYLKYLRGDMDEPHDRAFVWNIMCAMWTCKHKPELNNYAEKECPVCGDSLPKEAIFCGNCHVTIGKADYDPDSLMGEYEEENE